MGQRRTLVETAGNAYCSLVAPSIKASESETKFADGLASGALRLGKKKTSVHRRLGVNRDGIKRLGWSLCVLFSCLFPVQDDAQTSCSTGRPAAVLYRLWSVSPPCQQSPTE